jgi:arylsulfatase A-like enzyme
MSLHPSRPHILFIQTDQHLATTLGCYGSTLCRTPNIDALAREGVLFQNAYASCPICTPARASIQTGLYPFKHGMQTNIYTRGCMIHELPDHPALLSRRLQLLGYQRGLTGKWHLGFGDDREGHPEYQYHVQSTPMLAEVASKGSLPSNLGYSGDDFPGHGGIGMLTPQYRQYMREKGIELKTRKFIDYYPHNFELLSGKESSVTWFLTEQAIGHMTGFLESEQPFYYNLNYWGPHGPYHAPTEYLDLYRNLSIPPWESWGEDQKSKPSIHNAHRTETTADWTWSDYEQLLRTYFASITEIDDQVGRLVAFLKEKEIYENTVIIFAADHGDSVGVHHGLTDKSLFMYEETNRLPLIIREPGTRRAGEVEERFAGTCDLYSTILDYAGLERDQAERDGRSLRPLLDGTATTWRDCIVTEASGLDYLQYTQRALRWRHYKYVFNCGDPDELYDLREDPHELRNLVFSHAHQDLLGEMRVKLDTWMGEMGDGLRERFRRLRFMYPKNKDELACQQAISSRP